MIYEQHMPLCLLGVKTVLNFGIQNVHIFRDRLYTVGFTVVRGLNLYYSCTDPSQHLLTAGQGPDDSRWSIRSALTCELLGLTSGIIFSTVDTWKLCELLAVMHPCIISSIQYTVPAFVGIDVE